MIVRKGWSQLRFKPCGSARRAGDHCRCIRCGCGRTGWRVRFGFLAPGVPIPATMLTVYMLDFTERSRKGHDGVEVCAQGRLAPAQGQLRRPPQAAPGSTDSGTEVTDGPQ